ncbi:MAG: cupin domain-containing protein [Caldimonas sp.]
MRADRALPLLGGLSSTQFMRRHWQKKPLVVRAAAPDALPGCGPRQLFALATEPGVESRLVVRDAAGRWTLRHGPLPRRALPALATPGWSLLVQGVDLHDDAAHRLLSRFRFVADARLDDLMVSFASDGGGVGPHIDSYDVFLLQLAGRRRWRIAPPVADPSMRSDVPLRMLETFEATEEWLLDAGDILYLPPGWGHEGVAVGACLTASIGFRAADAPILGAEMLERIAEGAAEAAAGQTAAKRRRYRDAGVAATSRPARVPAALQRFADAAALALLADRHERARALGELSSEPKPGTRFDGGEVLAAATGVLLDRRTRMLYDAHHVFVNGESFRAAGRDARLMRRLADHRRLEASQVESLSGEAGELLRQWVEDGWCHALAVDGDGT